LGYYKYPFFSEEGADSKSRIILVDQGNIISTDADIANTFNVFFNTIVNTLPISKWNGTFIPCSDDPVINILSKFKHHPSILNIRNRISFEGFFNFQYFSETEVYHEILKLNVAKKVSGDIPVQVVKELNVIRPNIARYFNTSLEEGIFPIELKLADVIPVHKKTPKVTSVITDPLVFYLLYQRFLRNSFINNFYNS